MSLPRFEIGSPLVAGIVFCTMLMWLVPQGLFAQQDPPPENGNGNENEESEAANNEETAPPEEEEELADTAEEEAPNDVPPVEEQPAEEDAPNDVPPAEEPAEDEEVVEEPAEEMAFPAVRTSDLDERWQRVAGGYFNRAPVRSYVGGMVRWGHNVDIAWGQIGFEAWTELGVAEVQEMPLAILANWGISIGYSDIAGFGANFETIQPLYLGAKLNILAEEEYYFSAASLIGFIDDNVVGEYNPMNLLPGLGDFYWDLRAMFSYSPQDSDFGANAEFVLHFNFGTGNEVSVSWLLEVVYMLNEMLTLRGGFDFHTVGSGVNIFGQVDAWLDDGLMVFGQFKGFLSGGGRLFDIGLLGGVTYHF